MTIKRNIYMKKICSLLLLGMFIISAVSCTPKSQPVTYTDFYFNTVISLTFYNAEDAKLAEECFELCETYENMLSRTVEGSDVSNINRSNGKPTEVSPETYNLIKEALYYCELTDGKIDITVAPLMDAWNFTDSMVEQIPPSDDEIAELLTHVDYTNIEPGSDNLITLKDPDAAIDLGFIAKGYIADKLKEYLVSQGVEHALINLGGNICTIGSKPDGSSYTIGIQDPFSSQGTTLTTVSVTDSSAVTSGTYERFFTYEGVDYHHILDAATGYPCDNTLKSVTIVCPSSTQADALSTTCFVLGVEDALEYIESLEGAECLLIDENNNIHTSSGFPMNK